MAKHEFTLGKKAKFTPEAVTLNGVGGIIWTYRRLSPTGWMHMGKQFANKNAKRADVVGLFGMVFKKELVNA